MSVDIQAIAQRLIQAIETEHKHLNGVAQGVKLLYDTIRKEAEALDGSDESEVERGESDSSAEESK